MADWSESYVVLFAVALDAKVKCAQNSKILGSFLTQTFIFLGSVLDTN